MFMYIYVCACMCVYKSSLDLVGCFADPPVHLSLKRPPEHPNVIQTKFLLYNRSNREDPKVITYADRSESLLQSGLNVSKQLKVLIHGFKGSGSDYGLIRGINALLDLVNFPLLETYVIDNE